MADYVGQPNEELFMDEIYVLYENKKILLSPNHKYVIGRDKKCDIVLTDKHVSREHASLEYTDDGVLLTDLSSVNGTWFEGKRITATLLRSNDSFRIADNNLSIRTKLDDIKHRKDDSGDTMIFEKKMTDIMSQVQDTDLKDEVAVLRRLYNQKKEKLTELAFYDTLTGIYNRRYFDLKINEEVSRAIRYKRPLSLLMIDIDYFKKVNDTYGHPQGDRILSAVAQIVKESLRCTDLICRYGGEEIIVILPETKGKNAYAIGEKCRKKVATETKNIITDGVTVSIGVSEFSGIKTPEALITEVDRGLYQAKENGRNRVVFYKAIRNTPEEKK